MDTVLSVSIVLAVILFAVIAIAFLFGPIKRLFKKDKSQQDLVDSPFDYVPSRTMASRNLVWEDRRKGPRRGKAASGEAAKAVESPVVESPAVESEAEPPAGEDNTRRGEDRRRLKMPPPYPGD